MPLIDISKAAAVLADHLTASGAPVAKELLEEGLAKIPGLEQSGIAQLGILASALVDKFAGLMETHTLKIDPRAGGFDVTWVPK
jgi:hypothetical protein